MLAIWTLFLLRDFLDFDPLMIPPGKEFFTETQGHFVWERARECGLCAMWNSNVHGGNPAFADPLSAFLYPPVIVGSLIWGAINGAKAALIVTFFLAGMAQWWLGSVLGLGRVARLWAAAMAIAAGGLAGRLDDGDLPIITSTVACMVAIPAAIKLTRDGTRRSAAVLGGAIALMLVAGQAYLQITFAMLSPLFLVFVSGNRLGARHLAKRFGLAVAIGVMIAAPFLVPLLHFYPSFSKPIDPTFSLTQPFRYIPLNLVVSDRSLYKSDQLGTAPFPYLYINYLGWIAVIFAAIGCYTLWRRHDYRLLGFLVSWSVGAMWISSAMPLRWIRDITAPGDPVHDFVIGLRSIPIVAGLAIPSILALSAIGVDGLVKSRRRGLSLLWQMPTGPDRAVRLDARWLLVIPLLFALRSEQRFAEHFLYSTRQPIEAMTPVLDALTTPDSQWVDAPYGEELWIGQAAKRNLKLSYIGRVWQWKGRSDPQPVLEAVRVGAPPAGMTPVSTIGDVRIYRALPGSEYAAVTHGDGSRTICAASSAGGHIDVRCDLPQPGRLEIKESYFSGWKASSAGSALRVGHSSGWMTVALPAGRSTVKFRYRPWDVPAGITIMLLGLSCTAWCVVRREPEDKAGLSL